MNAVTPLARAGDGGALQALREVSARVGRDIALVQGGGGNTSIKLEARLWVKASGRWLAHAHDEPMFVPVDLDTVRARIAAGDADPVGPALCRDIDSGGLKPSIETTLHALLPHRVVLHVHSVDAIAWLVRPDARERLAERLGAFRWVFVPYARPGIALTRVVAEALARQPADVLLLGNHGLVVAGESEAAAEARLHAVVAALALPTRAAPVAAPSLLVPAELRTPYRLPADTACHGLATDPLSCRLAAGGAPYPDHVVFLGGGLPLIEVTPEATLLEQIERHAGAPALLVAGAGVLVHASLDAGGQAMLRCLADVLARVPPETPLLYLDAAEVDALSHWDAELYRRQQAQSQG
jgi:rhamnose utilization protein RhaD (predicted bifunctional aldolase and dehydrogenase)